MFNVRIKRFLNTEQIQIFSEPLCNKDSEREDKRDIIYSTGEIVPPNRTKFYNPFDDCMDIGCNMGNDEENLQRSVRRTKNKIYDVARCNHWEWFFTLTFNPEKVDSFNYDETTQKLSKWLNNMRTKCKDMKYLVVPEQHESGRWHFHGLFSNVENMKFVDSGKRDKKERVIYNVGSYRMGFTTATQIENVECAMSYIAKYTTKDLCTVTKGHKRYWCSRNVDMPIIEDYMVMKSEKEIKEMFEDSITYSKRVSSEYCDVTYLEMPIYTTNTNFSKRYRQIKPYIV